MSSVAVIRKRAQHSVSATVRSAPGLEVLCCQTRARYPNHRSVGVVKQKVRDFREVFLIYTQFVCRLIILWRRKPCEGNRMSTGSLVRVNVLSPERQLRRERCAQPREHREELAHRELFQTIMSKSGANFPNQFFRSISYMPYN